MLRKFIYKISNNKVKKAQIISTCGMSFMHGAQDGQKFIGILIIFMCLLKNVQIIISHGGDIKKLVSHFCYILN